MQKRMVWYGHRYTGRKTFIGHRIIYHSELHSSAVSGCERVSGPMTFQKRDLVDVGLTLISRLSERFPRSVLPTVS
jgi:hypothetical protein